MNWRKRRNRHGRINTKGCTKRSKAKFVLDSITQYATKMVGEVEVYFHALLISTYLI
jgi:hypothetical protein